MTQQDIADGYDALAADYDRAVQDDQWVRQVLWKHYSGVFRPGQHVLDVSCGTGIDTLFLARRGLRVTAVDISPGMLARLQDKAARAGLADRVTTRVQDYADLTAWPPASFDGIISAFAGLSTTADLAPFAVAAARLLRTGGRMIVHMLNRFSLWEWLGHVRHGRWAAASRVGRQRERVFTIGGRPIRHFLFFPAEAYRQFFAPHFCLRGAYGIGALRPPHAARHVPPPVVNLLDVLEHVLGGRRPIINCGRFFVLDLEKRAS